MKNKKGLVLSILMCAFIFGVTIPLFMTNHKKVKADTITDLSGSTWVVNDYPDVISNNTYYIDFTSNNSNWNIFRLSVGNDPSIIYGFQETVYVDGYWYNNAFKTIQITGGNDATNSSLISWLQNNATMTVAPTPPTPTGTQITHKYWSPYGAIQMNNNQVVGDNDIQYTVLFNEFTSSYDETTQTGLIFKGVLTEQDPAWSYIESLAPQIDGIYILYHGTTNIIDNAMWLEFNYGDYMDTDLYNFMDLWGYWFDDADAYIVGMNQGYVEGTEHGRALGQADGTQYTGLITGIFNGLGGLLSIQVFPNITIGLLIGLPLLLGVLIIIIKILRG